jgi:hypothetical protein
MDEQILGHVRGSKNWKLKLLKNMDIIEPNHSEVSISLLQASFKFNSIILILSNSLPHLVPARTGQAACRVRTSPSPFL